jgi:hypothetical protein
VILLAAGASVHVRDGEGRTACHLAGDQDMLDDLIAAGADFDAADSNGRTPRQNATDHCLPEPTAERVAAARRRIAHARLDFVRERAFQVCIGLQSLELDALQTCEVLLHSCGPVAPLVPFHHWWTIATTVKHFKQLQ